MGRDACGERASSSNLTRRKRAWTDEHGTTGEEEGRPFAELLHQQRNGDCHHEATQKLRQLIASVQETGRPGSLSLTLHDQALGTPRPDGAHHRPGGREAARVAAT